MRKSNGTVAGGQSWSPILLGGLGAVVGGDISADGTLEVCRTDVGGAYKRESTTNVWSQLVNLLPAFTSLSALTDFYQGTHEIAIAPSAAGTILMAHQGFMFRSTDRGATWANDSLNGATGVYMTTNTGSNKGVLHKLMFDPSNANVAYFGTQKNGLWQRLSTGWTQVSTGSVPVSPETTDGFRTTIVAIDPTSATTGSSPNVRKSVVYCSVNGSGIYKSTNGGATFAIVSGHPGAGAGYRATSFTCDQTGKLWLCLDNNAANNLYWSTNGGTSWTNVTTAPGYNVISVETDPKDANRQVGICGSGKPMVTTAKPTANGALSSSTAGALGAVTYFVKITYNGGNGETLAGPETSLAVAANKVLTVAAPPSPPPNVFSWNVYVSTATGTETKQASAIAIGSSWTEPTSGLIAGAALPTANTAWQAYQGAQCLAMATTCPITAQQNSAVAAASQDISGIIVPHPTQNIDVVWQGYGVYYLNSAWPTASGAGKLVFYEDTLGIEELVAQSIFVHPDGSTFLSGQDRGLVVMNSNTAMAAKVNYPSSAGLIFGHNTDYAIDNHNFLVTRVIGEASSDHSGYSTDKGQTWTPFAASPTTSWGGAIAVSNSNNIVVFPGQNVWPRYSTDQGATWNLCTFSGFAAIADGTENGWGFGIPTNNRRIIVCADKQNAGVFYAYNYGATGHETQMGVWKSTDGGANWTFKSNPAWGSGQSTGFHVILQMVAGHLFICSGVQNSYFSENPTTYSFRSEDGGATWTRFGAAINDIYYVALGAPKPGSSYAYAVYALGWLSGVFGLHRSDDKGATWTTLTLNTSFDQINCMGADMSTFGRVIVGYTGTGFAQCLYNYQMTLS